MPWLIYCAAVARTGDPRMQGTAEAGRLSHPNGVHAVMIDLEERAASNFQALGNWAPCGPDFSRLSAGHPG